MNEDREKDIKATETQIVQDTINATIDQGYVNVVVPGDEIKYRLRPPTAYESRESIMIKSKTFGRLIKDKEILTANEIISLLKERQIITPKEVKDFEVNQELYKAKMINWAQMKDPTVIEKRREEIIPIIDNINQYITKIKTHLVSSVESLCQIDADVYLCAVCSEKLVDGNWIAVFPDWKTAEPNQTLFTPFFEQYMETRSEALDFMLGGWLTLISGDKGLSS